MLEWAATVTSVADIAHEIVPPPQGLPQMPPEGQGTTTLVMVPASVFPGEACRENGGKGWTATTSPHRKGTLKVTFTHARDDSGAKFRPVHLKSTCVVPLPTPVKEGEPAPKPQRVGKPSAKRPRGAIEPKHRHRPSEESRGESFHKRWELARSATLA